jgi:hypothetical protein
VIKIYRSQEIRLEFGSARIRSKDGRMIMLSRHSGGVCMFILVNENEKIPFKKYRQRPITTQKQFNRIWKLLEKLGSDVPKRPTDLSGFPI